MNIAVDWISFLLVGSRYYSSHHLKFGFLVLAATIAYCSLFGNITLNGTLPTVSPYPFVPKQLNTSAYYYIYSELRLRLGVFARKLFNIAAIILRPDKYNIVIELIIFSFITCTVTNWCNNRLLCIHLHWELSA